MSPHPSLEAGLVRIGLVTVFIAVRLQREDDITLLVVVYVISFGYKGTYSVSSPLNLKIPQKRYAYLLDREHSS